MSGKRRPLDSIPGRGRPLSSSAGRRRPLRSQNAPARGSGGARRWIRTLGPREGVKGQGPQFHADYPPIGWARKQRMKRMLNGFKRYGITCPAQTRCQPDRLI